MGRPRGVQIRNRESWRVKRKVPPVINNSQDFYWLNHHIGLADMVHSVYEMSMTDQLKLVRDRREAVEAEIEHLIARIAALKAELPDLQVTERTLARLAGVESPPSLSSMFAEPSENEAERKPITSAQLAAALNAGGKPSGTPTTPDMIMTLLMESKRRGLDGMEPRDLTRAISRRWWPSVKS